MKRYKPASGTPKKKPTPFPGSSADMKRGKGRPVGRPKLDKNKGKGNLTMVDSSTGKRVRKSPTPFPGSPPKGRTKRGKDGIDILLPTKPKRGDRKTMPPTKLVPTPLRPKRLRPKDRHIITDETGKRIRRRKPVLMPVKGKGRALPKRKTGGSRAR